MTSDRNRITALCLGLAATAVLAGTASAQQRPMSINQWLQAERNNANMERAIREYERARFGTASQQPQQPYRSQPQYRAPQPTYQQPYSPPQQAQTPQAAPQQPVQPQPLTPNPQQPQPHQGQQPVYPQQQYQPSPQPYPYQTQSGGALPQHSNQPNTYQAPPDALEKIDNEYNPERLTGGPSRFYLGGHLGWPFLMTANVDAATADNELDMSMLAFRAGGTVGYQFGKGFSAELEGSYQLAEQKGSADGMIAVLAFMPMARFEFNRGHNSISPYITGGLGFAQFSADDLQQLLTGATDSDSGLAMAYQFGTGVTYPITGKTSLDFGYRYFGTTDADLELFDIEYSGNMSSHTLLLGIKHQL